MMKNFIKICAALLIIANFFYAQQLSKKMGSHVNGERYKGSYKNGLKDGFGEWIHPDGCLLYTSPSPRDGLLSRMPSSA